MLSEDLAAVLRTCAARADAWLMLAGAVTALCAWWLAPRVPEGRAVLVRRALVTLVCVAGVWRVLAHRSLFDDAYISFRYAQNLVDGHGLVWNVGERVEGYTNFVWTVLVALGTWVSRIEPAVVGLWLSVAVFPLNVFAAYRLERSLAGTSDGARAVLPLATAAIALQDSFVTAGSTGLETGFAALLVTAGALYLVHARSPRQWCIAGSLFIFATLTRPDHAIFYAVGSIALVADHAPLLRQPGGWRAALRAALAYAAPFMLYLAHMVWRRAFYGEWMPNTFYAKSADQSYYDQGVRYAATFYFASGFWALTPVLLAWLVWPTHDRGVRRFKVFLGLGFALYNFYVIKVGGDFMFGRFYVVLVPLVLVAVVQAARDLASASTTSRLGLAYAIAALVGASLGAVQLIAPREVKWGIAEERSFYPLSGVSPITVEHANFDVGQVMKRWKEAGLDLRLATSAIGMIGYYSRQELIDLAGLTDAHVARQSLEKRGRPGHERRAERSYIEARQPHIVRFNYHGKEREEMTRLEFGSIAKRPWYIYRYDRALMDRIEELTPQVHFKRFDTLLHRYVLRALPKRSPEELESDARFFQRYYFAHNEDPELLATWTAALEAARAR